MITNLNVTEYRLLEEHPCPTQIRQLNIVPWVLAEAKEQCLAAYHQVEILHVKGETQVTFPLPTIIFEWKKLHTLTLQGVQVANIWPQLSLLPQLRTLNIEVAYLKALPPTIVQLQNLEEINWLATRFARDFEGWALLHQLPRLQWMSLLFAQTNASVLKDLLTLPLKFLLLSKNLLIPSKTAAAAYFQQLWYSYGHTAVENRHYSALLYHCQNSAIDWQQRALLLNLLAHNSASIARFASPQRLLAISDSDWSFYNFLRLNALEYFVLSLPKRPSLYQGANVAVLGKIASPRKRLCKQLEAVGIVYSAKITAKTTHVLLGHQTKGAYQKALDRKLPFLLERQVLAYILSTGDYYLLQETAAQQEQLSNIQALLKSGQESSIRVALSLMEQGGFPSRLLTTVFFAYFNQASLAIRRLLGRLLRQHGSAMVIEYLYEHKLVLYRNTSERTLYQQLEELHYHSELDVLALATYIYEQTGLAKSFLDDYTL